MLEFPGLIDPHVHLREPGATHKEDFDTGTAAALAGGFTAVLAMPNTDPPLVDGASLALARAAARTKARCDYGLYLGAGERNVPVSPALAAGVCGLKVYMDQTYGPLRMSDLSTLVEHFRRWPGPGPIACHAEGRSLAVVLALATLFGQRVHICHVSRGVELELIRLAKERGASVTCEVTPHHLFLAADDLPAIGTGRGEVRPRLAPPADVAALWDGLDIVDCFASDHAPHTLAEKDGADPPPGFPGLETALGLLHGAVRQGRLELEDLIRRMLENPRRIFGLPAQEDTRVEFDPGARWEVQAAELHSRCGWTPFEGMTLIGRVRRVTLRGRLVYEDGEVRAAPGLGRELISPVQLIPA
jgi:carbamoyl-phosphate synthase/aspartate carbamoyltransferase/dihydroorotase